MGARTPEDCDRLFGERLNAGDLNGMMLLYEPYATFGPQQGEVVSGIEGIRQALAEFLAMKPKIKMNVTKVVKAGGDLAALYNDLVDHHQPFQARQRRHGFVQSRQGGRIFQVEVVGRIHRDQLAGQRRLAALAGTSEHNDSAAPQRGPNVFQQAVAFDHVHTLPRKRKVTIWIFMVE